MLGVSSSSSNMVAVTRRSSAAGPWHRSTRARASMDASMKCQRGRDQGTAAAALSDSLPTSLQQHPAAAGAAQVSCTLANPQADPGTLGRTKCKPCACVQQGLLVCWPLAMQQLPGSLTAAVCFTGLTHSGVGLQVPWRVQQRSSKQSTSVAVLALVLLLLVSLSVSDAAPTQCRVAPPVW